MTLIQNIIWLLIGILIFIVFYIGLTLWRNNAAKTDSALHNKNDTVKSSVSLKPRKNTTK